jgi:purine nucleoside phosphorylase
MMAGVLALPHDVVDYTWGRAHSYSDENRLLHVEFSEPFDARLRRALASAGGRAGVAIHDGGVYGCTQGPRFESPAEIDRMERDGCTLVGMTGMPEAALAAELELPYASLCLVVNPAAGRGEGAIDLAAITAVSEDGMVRIARLLDSLLRAPLSLA